MNEQEQQITLDDRFALPNQNAARAQQDFSLPPTDSGKDAWLMLASCFFMEGFAWALPYSFGIFQEYYSNNEVLRGDASSIPLIGTIAIGVMYLGSPVNLLILRQWPQNHRKYLVAGLLSSSLSLILASFATRIWQVILTQGFLYSVGCSMMYYPTMVFLDEWFVQKKGMAFGIAWAGSSLWGVVVPFFISWSLRHFSFRTTLRVWALATVVLAIPLIPFIKPRIPAAARSLPRKLNLRFAISRPFLPLQVGSLLEGLGYFLPGIFLPSYAHSVGLNNTVATVGVALINIGSFFGCLTIGFLVDRRPVTDVIMLCTIGATLSVTLLWGFAKSAPIFCVFALLYGFFAGSFSSTWPGVVLETTHQDPSAESGLIYALLVAGRGLGGVLSGPFSTALLKASSLTYDFSFGYGSKYGWLIFFTGMCNLLGGTGFVARKFGWT